jgi:hypothetical protein
MRNASPASPRETSGGTKDRKPGGPSTLQLRPTGVLNEPSQGRGYDHHDRPPSGLGLKVAVRTTDAIVSVAEVVLRDMSNTILVGGEDKVLVEHRRPKLPA